MPPKLKAILVAALASASVAAGPGASNALAGYVDQRRAIVAHQRLSACAPYYYSRWNPYSAFSIYDHLSGGRQVCALPSECCDNNHRVTN
jgi:hypothetical protein